jgi:hypothetical protein
VKVASTANKIAARELQFFATPQTHVTIHVNRQAATLNPGSVIRWSNKAYQITDMVLRIHKISLSEADDGVIVLECTRDKYSDIASIFDDPDTNWINDFGIRPAAPDCLVAVEVPPAPPFNSGNNWESPTFGGVMVNASPLPVSSGGTSGPGGYLSGNTSLVGLNTDGVVATTGDERGSTPCGSVGVAYSTSPGSSYYYDTGGAGLTVSFDNPVDFVKDFTESEVRAGRSIISIGDEYLSYENATALDAPTYRSSSQAETAANQSSISIALPAGVVDNDLLIAMINIGTKGLASAPAGWTHVQGSPYRTTGGGIDNNFVVMTKVASGETGPYVWERVDETPMEIQGSIHAFVNATLESAVMEGYYDSIPSGVTPNAYLGSNKQAELFVTGIAVSDSWWSGSSLILPTKGFTEIDDSSSAISGHLQAQYGPIPLETDADDLDRVSVDLNLAGTTPESAFTTVLLGLRGPTTRSYRLTNVWRGLFDTIPKDHSVGDPVFFVSEANIGRTISRKDFSCDSEVVISHQTALGVRSTFEAPVFDVGLALTRRSERPARPTSFVLRNDGADAAASGPEIDYAYNVDNPREVVHSVVSGADTKLSSAGVYGDVWTNDLRATWNRRPRLTSCESSVVRGDDADAPYGKDENTYLCVEGKGDQESEWSKITQNNIQGDKVTSNAEFVDMSNATIVPGAIRICAIGDSPLTGEELASREAESLTVNVHTSRQLLLNPNFRPYWDVDSDSSVASARGEVLPGNPVYSARGWRNVTAGAGRPRFKVMDGSIHQGTDTVGFAFTGEFISGEYVTLEQVVAVPYLDTEGSEVYLSWWLQTEIADETEWYSATIDTLDVNGAVLNTTNVTDSAAHTTDTWSKYDLKLTGMSASVRSIRVQLAIRNTTTGSPAICKGSLIMGREIDENQLTNPNFNTPLTGWTNSGGGGAFTAELSPTHGGGINPVDSNFSRFAQSGPGTTFVSSGGPQTPRRLATATLS